MSRDYEINLQSNSNSTKRPQVTSYDSCNEHSIEHWIEVRLLVKEFEEETTATGKPQMLGL